MSQIPIGWLIFCSGVSNYPELQQLKDDADGRAQSPAQASIFTRQGRYWVEQ